MWNVLVEEVQINSVPYDLEQLAELLSQLSELDEPVGSIVFVDVSDQ